MAEGVLEVDAGAPAPVRGRLRPRWAPRSLLPADVPAADRRIVVAIVGVASAVMLLLLTGGRPWALFARGDFSADFYDAQADALAGGRLGVDPEVASIEGIVRGGDTHLYYGIFLALVRVPLYLLTDAMAGRLARLSILVAYAVALVAAAHLAQAARGVVGDGAAAPSRWRLPSFVAAVAVSPALFAGGWITVYHETEMWACALGIVGLAGALRLLAGPSRRAAFAAGAAASLCTMTRVSVGLGVTAAVLVAVAVAYRTTLRRAVGPAAAALAGLAVHAAVNTARFGGPLSMPFEDQVLTRVKRARADWFADHGNSFFGAEFVPSTLLHYLRPDAVRLERVLPFVRFGPPASELGGIEFESNTPSTSLTIAATLLCALAVVGLVWAARRRRFALLAVTAAAAAGAVPTVAIGFVANRYLIDFLPALAVPAACAVWLRRPRRVPVRGLVAALAFWGALVNVALAIWVSQLRQPGFIEMRYRLDAALFPDPPPALVRVSPASHDLALFGTVAVDAGRHCRGVYVAGDESWEPVERPAGDRELAGTAVAGDDVSLAENDRWALHLRGDGAVVFTAGGDTKVLGEVDATPGSRVDYVIVADAVTGERWTNVGGTFAYLPVAATDGPIVGYADGGGLCEDLASRLG